jgi:hypothetical protein
MDQAISCWQKKGLSPITIKTYTTNITNMLKSLKKGFKDTEATIELLQKYKPNTQRSKIISIVSFLDCSKDDSKPNRKAYDFYNQKMKDINSTLKQEESKNEKSDSQEKNWIEWSDVLSKQKELKELKDKSFNDYLNYLVLSLYTLIPPRRNEYSKVLVVPSSKGLDEHKNYLDLAKGQFILGDFKTVKSKGIQMLDVPDNLMEIVNGFLKLRGIKKIKKNESVPLLVDSDNKPLTASNAITRILNNIFHKKIGASMLRHIFVSDKFGDEDNERKEVAEQMGHSVSMSQDYVKK